MGRSIIVLDLDGVIIDSFQFHIEGWKEIMNIFGKSLNNFNFNNLHSVETKTAINYLLEKNGIAKGYDIDYLIKVKNTIRDYHISRLTPQDVDNNIINLMIRYPNALYVCFAMTTVTHEILKKLDIVHRFTFIYSGTDLGKTKLESIENLIDILNNSFNAPKRNIVVLDDSLFVCDKFLNIGIKSFLVPCKQKRKNFYDKSVFPYLNKILL